MNKYFIPHAPVKPEPPSTEPHRIVEEFAGEPDKGNFQVGDHDTPDPIRRRGNS